jgi:nucleoside phosphorylase
MRDHFRLPDKAVRDELRRKIASAYDHYWIHKVAEISVRLRALQAAYGVRLNDLGKAHPEQSLDGLFNGIYEGERGFEASIHSAVEKVEIAIGHAASEAEWMAARDRALALIGILDADLRVLQTTAETIVTSVAMRASVQGQPEALKVKIHPGQMDVRSARGNIDFGIITMREDEYSATLAQFSPRSWATGYSRYEISTIKRKSGDTYIVAIGRVLEQGRVPAAMFARNMIADLDPKWILLLGIAGAVPSKDFTLGDVVCASRLHDFSVRAIMERKGEKFNVSGGPMHPKVQRLLSSLLAIKGLTGWNTDQFIKAQKPKLEVPKLDSGKYYGPKSYMEDVRDSLIHHFGDPNNTRAPLVTAQRVGSTDALIKSIKPIMQWQEAARSLAAVEMELGGVYEAAYQLDKQHPVLAIRGISDIVGFKRDDAWTKYACNTAAAFAFALARSEAPFFD